MLLDATHRYFSDKGQIYNMHLYLALISTTYFGLFRIGEMTAGPQVVKACDVHIALNKRKFLFILRSSKTHTPRNHQQSVKVKSNGHFKSDMYCPYELPRNYLTCRLKYKHVREQFFVFRDGSQVMPAHFRNILKLMLSSSGFNSSNYSCHSLHAGRSKDLLALGLSVETIKKIGRWESNAVYAYLK